MQQKVEEKGINASLEESLVQFQLDTPKELFLLREQSQLKIIAQIESVEGVEDVTRFPVVLFSEDNRRAAKRLLDSPPPDNQDHTFLNTDYNVDPDALDLAVGISMTRSGSLDSIVFDSQEIFFDKFEDYKVFPRAVTPTELAELSKVPTAVQEREIKEQTPNIELEVLVLEELVEEKIDRDAAISAILKNLDLKDKYSSKNINLQNKLAEHFKRKRVIINALI